MLATDQCSRQSAGWAEYYLLFCVKPLPADASHYYCCLFSVSKPPPAVCYNRISEKRLQLASWRRQQTTVFSAIVIEWSVTILLFTAHYTEKRGEQGKALDCRLFSFFSVCSKFGELLCVCMCVANQLPILVCVLPVGCLNELTLEQQ